MAELCNLETKYSENRLSSSNLPSDEFKNEKRKMKGRCIQIFLLLTLELLLGIGCLYFINQLDLNYRVFREIENRVTGSNHFSTGVYSGDTDFGYFFQKGIFEYKTGTTYNGNWKDNFMSGLGVLEIPNEGKYSGNFEESQKNGYGTFNWDDGTFYKGHWKADKMHGQGTYKSADNIKYVGTFENNQFKEGKCSFSNYTGDYLISYKDFKSVNVIIKFKDGTCFEGTIDDKSALKKGEFTFSNGDQYSGTFMNGLRSGKGIYTWENGDSYDGDWNEDLIDGVGIYKFADGKVAEGTFVNNVFNEGTYTIENDFGKYIFSIKKGDTVAVNMTLKDGTVYNGEMYQNKLSGTAQIAYSNGDRYEGNVLNGHKDGSGYYWWKNGASYNGSWKNDRMEGTGIYYYPEKESKGCKITGEFKNGLPNGKLTYLEKFGSPFQTDWVNGRCVKVYE